MTLDPDVDAKVRALARERGVSFTEALNNLLRLGLSSGAAAGQARPYRLPARRLGLRRGIDLDHALRLAAELEDEETVRKLELRK